jgi:hypothetical protein
MNLFAHIPFSTLRDHQAFDQRKLADGKHLRRSVEIPYMESLKATPTSKDLTGCIHEAQVSIHISIIDQSCWNAYVFEDTYYKTGKEAERLDSFLRGSSFYRLDALAGTASDGELDSTLFEGPLDYFLILFEARIKQSYLELDRIVDKLEKSVKL